MYISMKKTTNSFMKWFTIILIIVFLLWTLGTWILVLSWPSNTNQDTQETTK